MSVAQQRAHDTLRAAYAIEYVTQPLDLTAVFGRAAPIILEIGFGMGDATAAIAAARPEHDFIGIEVHGPGVGSLLLQTEARALNNLKIIQHDAVEVLRDMIPDGSLAGVHIFFPDPWHKTRHNKRRLIKPDFVAQLARKLAPGGYLHAATDWEDYAIQILAVLSAEPALMNSADGYAPRPDYRPLTKFEQRGIRLGHGVWDIVFRKCD
ncbi:MAG: tRNA (guanosine(46)-N7)-methyltransferase TrmB [Pseudomonadota bacterium]